MQRDVFEVVDGGLDLGIDVGEVDYETDQVFQQLVLDGGRHLAELLDHVGSPLQLRLALRIERIRQPVEIQPEFIRRDHGSSPLLQSFQASQCSEREECIAR